MEWLNYHHLLYFYTVAREGSVARAAQALRLAQPTLSGQIRKLEHVLDEKLFERRGRGLVLTEMGRVVYRYAEEIFSLGGELLDTVRGRPSRRPPRFGVGIAESLPKLVAHRLLSASRLSEQGVQLVLREGKTEDLLAALAAQNFDLVIADAPLPPHFQVRAFNHLLGESGVTLFAAPALAKRHRAGFPRSLDGAPLLLPTTNTAMRRALDQWLQEQGIRPQLVAEIEDSALLKEFGQHGAGIFAAPSVVASEVRRQYRVQALGVAKGVRERFYAITLERRITHPATAAIAAAARERLFH
ncbi:MAG TPA: transcriptional activator NhaR [Myxococcota bacterium]|nr:transcriptional activator NhaR [Myxococcota bacterium]